MNTTASPPPQPSLQVAQASSVAEASGSSIRLNNKTVPGQWQQKNGRIGISTAAITNLLGVELLSATDPAQQSVRWFPLY